MQSPRRSERVVTNNKVETTPPMVVAEFVPPEFVDSEYPSSRTAVTSANSSRFQDSEQRPGLCCGCLCDYRRATIVAVTVEAIVGLLWILSFYMDSWNLVYTSEITDETMMHIINDSNQLQGVVNGITVMSSFLAFVGALQFAISPITWNIIWIVLSFMGGILIRLRTAENLKLYDATYEYKFNWFEVTLTAVLSALFMYPQIAFIHEVNAGVLSKQEYRGSGMCCQVQRKT